MNTSSHRVIATRRLTYKIKGDSALNDFTVCISEPYLLTDGEIDIPFAEGAAGCVISFNGLPENGHTVIGGDTFQALELAVSFAESNLRRLSKKYDFYFEGDPYFED
ncbi:hypothetical protein [Burkholderia pseudomallei]|uniref:hypothetical protein n=1 Tax=Burkholderia pseudomallei TaxID=28450 RepID=UPI000B2E09A5|nr:hypothetical protein [Burkholderia pseudomallei]